MNQHRYVLLNMILLSMHYILKVDIKMPIALFTTINNPGDLQSDWKCMKTVISEYHLRKSLNEYIYEPINLATCTVLARWIAGQQVERSIVHLGHDLY